LTIKLTKAPTAEDKAAPGFLEPLPADQVQDRPDRPQRGGRGGRGG